MKKDLTEAVKAMKLDEAISIAENAKSAYAADPEKAMTAILKLQALSSVIAPALEGARSEVQKLAKKANESIDVTAKVTVRINGNPQDKQLSMSIKSFDTTKTELDFDSFKQENGVVIEDDAENPRVKHIKVGDAMIWGVLKAPTIAGNPGAFEAAIAAGSIDSKYKTTKTVSKYAVEVNLVDDVGGVPLTLGEGIAIPAKL